MTVTAEVKAVLSAENHASPVVRTLIRDLERLHKTYAGLAKLKVNVPQAAVQSATATKAAESFSRTEAQAMAALRRRWAFETRMGQQKAAEARDLDQNRQTFESAAVRDLRRRMSLTSRMARQQLAEQRTVEAERQRDAADARRADAESQRGFRERMRFSSAMGRQRAAEERRVDRERAQQDRRDTREAERTARADERRQRDVRHGLHQGTGRIGDVGREVMTGARTVSMYGTIGAGIVASIATTGLKARAAIDSAEANARMFGGMSRSQVEGARTGWLNSAAIDNAFKPSDALNAWTEVLKAGIPQLAAPDVTKSIMGASAGLDLNVAETTKLVGRLSTLTQDPAKFNSAAIDSMLNGIAVVAKVTAADSRELVSSLRRGAGVLGSSKMSVTDLTAFTGAGISAGMQEGKAGTFMDFLVNDLVNAKNSRGQRGEDLQKAFSLLGLGTRSSVSRQAATDPTTLLLKMFERMEKMNPEKAGQVATLLGMREWRGEVLQMMKAAPSLRQTVQAVRDPKNANHLQQARDEKLGTLGGLMRQLRATGDLALEAIGSGLEGIVRDIGKFFVNFGKSAKLDVIQAHVRTLLDGFIDGLGFANVTQLLERIFGKPGDMDFSRLDSFFRFAQGFGQGIREVVDSLLSIGRAFAGQDASAETLGKLTAKLFGFSLALVAVSPVVSVIAGIATALGALAVSALAIGKLIPKIGIAGGAAGATGLTAALTGAGGIIAAAFLATIANKLGILKAPDTSKGWGRGILEFLDPGLASRVYGDKQTDKQTESGAWIDPPARVQRQTHNGAFDDRPLIHKASLASNETINRLERFISSPTTANALGRKAAAWQHSYERAEALRANLDAGRVRTAATPNVPPAALGRGPSVPGWYGRGGGSASSNPANTAASAAMLDAIAGTESGKAGYDAVLGNGRYGTPSKPVSTMTLDEAYAFGRQVRARHGSSSALGRYQIVGQTMRAAQKALGIDGGATFDPAMQDRMARWIARNQGLGAWEGLKHNPGAMARARAAMAAGGAQDAPTGRLASGDKTVAGDVHPLDGKGRLTSDFGIRRHPISGAFKLHKGIDLAAPAGSAVKAMQAGTVSIDRSGDISIRHPDGTSTTYRHLNTMVENGAKVSAGDVIGRLRAYDPRSTGPHLHLESRDANGALRDPKALLSAVPEATEGFKSSGWKRQDGSPVLTTPTPAEAADKVPSLKQLSPWKKQDGGERSPAAAGGATSGTPTTVTINNTIHAGNQSPQELAGHIQRHVTEAWNYRSHDLEPELT